jgi:hypothetical protein
MRSFYYDLPSRAIMRFSRSLRLTGIVTLLAGAPAVARAQTADSVTLSTTLSTNYWKKFAVGFTTSILLHEAGHILTSIAVGGHPSFGFDELRPTVYSGIDSHTEPHKQFLFSVAGLTVQSLIDEGILDIPHSRGSAFERGMLGGGIGTTLFYLTIGRRGSVSDVDFIARTHAMNKTQVTLLFGSIAALHTIRISRDKHYANFFARPRDDGGLDVGVSLSPP